MCQNLFPPSFCKSSAKSSSSRVGGQFLFLSLSPRGCYVNSNQYNQYNKNSIKIGDMRVDFYTLGRCECRAKRGARVTGSPKIARFLGYIGASAQRSQKTGKIRRIFHESDSDFTIPPSRLAPCHLPLHKGGSTRALYTIKTPYFSRTCALKNIPMMPESADKTRSGAHALCASVRASQKPIKIARF